MLGANIYYDMTAGNVALITKTNLGLTDLYYGTSTYSSELIIEIAAAVQHSINRKRNIC